MAEGKREKRQRDRQRRIDRDRYTGKRKIWGHRGGKQKKGDKEREP